MNRLVLLVALAAATGCNDCSLNRMIDQPRYTAYEACPVCPEGTIMMMPPGGTVARGERLDSGELTTGRSGTEYVTRIPIAVTKPLLARGRDRFNIYCAACHGRLCPQVKRARQV